MKTRNVLNLSISAHPAWERCCLARADQQCSSCWGLGKRHTRRGEKICRCVLRSVFRACYDRFRTCVFLPPPMRTASYGAADNYGSHKPFVRGFLNQEYIADFTLIAKRTLPPADYRIFSARYLLGADQPLICRKLGIKRGDYFHSIYHIEERMGKALAERQPYPLFPVAEYFAPSRVKAAKAARREAAETPVRAPMRREPGKQSRAMGAAASGAE